MLTDETPNREDSQQQPENAGSPKPANLDEALNYIQALEKRVAEQKERASKYYSETKSLSERLSAIEQGTRKRLEEEGNYRELANKHAADLESLKPLAERAQALEAIIRESNEARIKSVPENMRNLIPVDYAPERLQAWLNANEGLLRRSPAPDFDAGAGGSGGSASTKLTDDQRAMAKRFGMTEEQYIAQLKKLNG